MTKGTSVERAIAAIKAKNKLEAERLAKKTTKPKGIKTKTKAFPHKNAPTSKAWITSKGEIMFMDKGQWHIDWLNKHGKDYGVTVTRTEGEEGRKDALDAGWFRVNLENRNGNIVFEGLKDKFHSKIKDAIFDLVSDNKESVNSLTITLMNHNYKPITSKYTTSLSMLDDREWFDKVNTEIYESTKMKKFTELFNESINEASKPVKKGNKFLFPAIFAGDGTSKAWITNDGEVNFTGANLCHHTWLRQNGKEYGFCFKQGEDERIKALSAGWFRVIFRRNNVLTIEGIKDKYSSKIKDAILNLVIANDKHFGIDGLDIFLLQDGTYKTLQNKHLKKEAYGELDFEEVDKLIYESRTKR